VGHAVNERQTGWEPLRYISDLALTVATLLALVGMFGYCKISDMLRPASQDRV
jgi:hypothetical protein